MCLIVLAWRVIPGMPLLLAANRDEYHRRPTLPAARWSDAPLIGGRDLEAGGGWLLVRENGRFAAVTNVRNPADRADGPSRGLLVRDFVAGDEPAPEFLGRVTARPDYRGFNLLLGDGADLWYGSNRNGQTPRRLPPGFHGLSNGRLDEPWPKVVRARTGLEQRVTAGIPDDESLLQHLADRWQPPDADLPDTGVSRDWERVLAPVFIHTDGYGTRCATVLRLYDDGRGRLTEQGFDADGRPSGRVCLTWEGKQP